MDREWSAPGCLVGLGRGPLEGWESVERSRGAGGSLERIALDLSEALLELPRKILHRKIGYTSKRDELAQIAKDLNHLLTAIAASSITGCSASLFFESCVVTDLSIKNSPTSISGSASHIEGLTCTNGSLRLDGNQKISRMLLEGCPSVSISCQTLREGALRGAGQIRIRNCDSLAGLRIGSRDLEMESVESSKLDVTATSVTAKECTFAESAVVVNGSGGLAMANCSLRDCTVIITQPLADVALRVELVDFFNCSFSGLAVSAEQFRLVDGDYVDKRRVTNCGGVVVLVHKSRKVLSKLREERGVVVLDNSPLLIGVSAHVVSGATLEAAAADRIQSIYQSTTNQDLATSREMIAVFARNTGIVLK